MVSYWRVAVYCGRCVGGVVGRSMHTLSVTDYAKGYLYELSGYSSDSNNTR